METNEATEELLNLYKERGFRYVRIYERDAITNIQPYLINSQYGSFIHKAEEPLTPGNYDLQEDE